MPAVLEEFKVDELTHQPEFEKKAEGNCAKEEINAFAEKIEKKLDESKGRVVDVVEETRRSAERIMKRGQSACEDLLEDTTHQVKKHPIPALGLAFAAGALIGVLIPKVRK
jgi:ElaB/YqjD/DUF883 family membrane-anchored ribosome-binding protein